MNDLRSRDTACNGSFTLEDSEHHLPTRSVCTVDVVKGDYDRAAWSLRFEPEEEPASRARGNTSGINYFGSSTGGGNVIYTNGGNVICINGGNVFCTNGGSAVFNGSIVRVGRTANTGRSSYVHGNVGTTGQFFAQSTEPPLVQISSLRHCTLTLTIPKDRDPGKMALFAENHVTLTVNQPTFKARQLSIESPHGATIPSVKIDDLLELSSTSGKIFAGGVVEAGEYHIENVSGGIEMRAVYPKKDSSITSVSGRLQLAISPRSEESRPDEGATLEISTVSSRATLGFIDYEGAYLASRVSGKNRLHTPERGQWPECQRQTAVIGSREG